MKEKKKRLYILKCKTLINLSIALIISAVFLKYSALINTNADYNFSILNINTKDIQTVQKAIKKTPNTNILDSIATDVKALEVDVSNVSKSFKEINMHIVPNSRGTIPNRQTWYLPVEMGTVTSSPSYYHVALDITSPRGENEVIYPIANGEISGIYTDSAGAKIVTVRHFINDSVYSSQYVHFSRYAPNLYVGKQVTVNDALGFMGQTGIATGVHLHLAVVDCNMFEATDANCSDLNSFFRYVKYRYNQGFIGFSSIINVPGQWNSR